MYSTIVKQRCWFVCVHAHIRVAQGWAYMAGVCIGHLVVTVAAIALVPWVGNGNILLPACIFLYTPLFLRTPPAWQHLKTHSHTQHLVCKNTYRISIPPNYKYPHCARKHNPTPRLMSATAPPVSQAPAAAPPPQGPLCCAMYRPTAVPYSPPLHASCPPAAC